MIRTYRRLLQNRSVQALMLSVVLLVTSQGFGQGLYNYIQLYIWGLTSAQISLLALAPFISATLAFVLTPRLALGREKRTLAIGLGIVAVVGQPTPLLLRLAGLFPGPDSPLMLPLLTFHSAFESLVWVMFAIVASSMMADLVEETEVETGRRTEGSLFALRILADKAVAGFGVLLSGLVLEFVRFPTGAPAGSVPAATLNHLALTYAPLTIVLGLGSAAALLGYRVTRQGHERNLQVIPPTAG
jgi:Na+/melibiose symporter-like transporter